MAPLINLELIQENLMSFFIIAEDFEDLPILDF